MKAETVCRISYALGKVTAKSMEVQNRLAKEDYAGAKIMLDDMQDFASRVKAMLANAMEYEKEKVKK